MAIFFEIPLLEKTADQTLDVTIAEVPYTLRVLWNERFQYFSLSISEKGGDAILTNVKMVQNFPLVRHYRRLPFAGDLYFLHHAGKVTRPTYDDLGPTGYGLFYYDPETLIEYPLPLTAEA